MAKIKEHELIHELNDIFDIFDCFDVAKLKSRFGLGRSAEIENTIIGFLEEYEDELAEYILDGDEINYDGGMDEYDEDACMLEED